MKNIDSYIDVLLNSDIHLLIIGGPPGVGKSSEVLKYIQEMGFIEDEHFVYETGYITPLALFRSLSKSRILQEPKLIIYDDIDSILKNKISIGILKGALADVRGVRTVSYQSSTSKDNDQSFEFNGKVILILNDIGNNKMIEPLLDRGIFYNIELSKQELGTHIEECLVSMFPTMDKEEKDNVWKQMKVFMGLGNFSIRTVNRGFAMYKNNKEEWYRLFKKSLRIK